MKYKEQINHILADCNFKMIHSVMESQNWKWSYSDGTKKIPPVDDLRSIAEHCLKKAAESLDDSSTCSVGGFEAVKIEKTLELRFNLVVVNPLSHLLNIDAKNELAGKKK